MVLKEDTTSKEDMVEVMFPAEHRSDKFEALKGYFLASAQISRQLFNEDPDIVLFEIEEVIQNIRAQEQLGLMEPQVSRRAEANIGSLFFRPVLDPTVARLAKEDKSMRNCFKATFGKAKNRLIVIILPFSVPDNICHFAAQEVSLCYD